MVFGHNSPSNLSEWRPTTLAEYTLEAFGPVLLLSILCREVSQFSHPKLTRLLVSDSGFQKVTLKGQRP